MKIICKGTFALGKKKKGRGTSLLIASSLSLRHIFWCYYHGKGTAVGGIGVFGLEVEHTTTEHFSSGSEMA